MRNIRGQQLDELSLLVDLHRDGKRQGPGGDDETRLDVALEALQEAWRAKRASMDELWHYATLCRVANVMRP